MSLNAVSPSLVWRSLHPGSVSHLPLCLFCFLTLFSRDLLSSTTAVPQTRGCTPDSQKLEAGFRRAGRWNATRSQRFPAKARNHRSRFRESHQTQAHSFRGESINRRQKLDSVAENFPSNSQSFWKFLEGMPWTGTARCTVTRAKRVRVSAEVLGSHSSTTEVH